MKDNIFTCLLRPQAKSASYILKSYCAILPKTFQKWKDCNKKSGPDKLRGSHVCNRYHFHKDETEEDVKRIYDDILMGRELSFEK